MERREFLFVSGSLAMTPLVRREALDVQRSNVELTPHATLRTQNPTLGPQVFAQRISRAQDELKSRKLDLLVVEPGTNFQYFTGYNPGRSERLILLMLPASGAPVIVCPSFEVERIKRNTVISDARGWEEHE